MSRKGSVGFTLIELVVVMAILSIVAALMTPNMINEINQLRAKKTTEETQLIIDAARSFRVANGAWPGNATCSDALKILTNTTPPMLVGVGLSNMYNSPYSTSCTAYSFSLDQYAVPDWDGFVANSLAGTQIVDATTSLLRTTIGIPGSEPALDSKLSRIATGNAELNRMRTDLLLGGNNINEVGTVNAVAGTFSGTVSAGTVSATNISGTNIAGTNVNATSLGTQSLLVQQNSVFVGPSQFSSPTYFYDQVVLNKVAAVGQGGCTSGAIARDAAGATLSCQYGVWKSLGGQSRVVGTYAAGYQETTQMIRESDGFCVLNGFYTGSLNNYDEFKTNVYVSGGYWYVSTVGSNYPRGQTAYATCFGS